jgi:hypothetical protein
MDFLKETIKHFTIGLCVQGFDVKIHICFQLNKLAIELVRRDYVQSRAVNFGRQGHSLTQWKVH